MKNNLRELRIRRDLTQEELGQKLGVSRQSVIALEKGKYDPSIKLAFKIARFFSCTIEAVFIYEEE
ncbi:MAG: helix-turn-helix transcriptional regulator [Candidatus Odinarchaeota archaeon]